MKIRKTVTEERDSITKSQKGGLYQSLTAKGRGNRKKCSWAEDKGRKFGEAVCTERQADGTVLVVARLTIKPQLYSIGYQQRRHNDKIKDIPCYF